MKRYRMDEKGFTIIEGLIVLVMSSLLMTLVFKFQIMQNREYDIQGQISFLQKDVRSAMETLENDIRMTGSGFPKSALAGSITIIDGMEGDQTEYPASPDEVIVLRVVPGVQCALVDSMSSPDEILQCDDASDFSPGWAVISDEGGAETFLISDVDQGTHTFEHSTMALSRSYKMGSRIQQTTYREYAIDTQTDPEHPKLVYRNWDGTEQPVADNIEDIQFTYILENGSETSVKPVDIDDLIMVNILIVGRTKKADPAFKEDGYRRRTLASKVQLRNFHLRKGI